MESEEVAESSHDASVDHDICVICLGEVTEGATTSCGHTAFDFICLVNWLERSSTCPLCKAQVSRVTYGHTSTSEPKIYTVRPTLPTATARPDATTAHSLRHGTLLRNRRRPRLSRPLAPYTTPSPSLALLRRRHVYRHSLYSLHVGANRISQYRNLTPSLIAFTPALQSRARTWIRRELRVFNFLYTDATPSNPTTSSNAEWLLMYILSIIKAVEMKGSSGQAEDMLQEFLGRENARLFLHELNAWLRSPYERLSDWDRAVQYSEALPDEFDDEGRAVSRTERKGMDSWRPRGSGREEARGRSRSPGERRSSYRERLERRSYEPR